jgi:hypothetical protein
LRCLTVELFVWLQTPDKIWPQCIPTVFEAFYCFFRFGLQRLNARSKLSTVADQPITKIGWNSAQSHSQIIQNNWEWELPFRRDEDARCCNGLSPKTIWSAYVVKSFAPNRTNESKV